MAFLDVAWKAATREAWKGSDEDRMADVKGVTVGRAAATTVCRMTIERAIEAMVTMRRGWKEWRVV